MLTRAYVSLVLACTSGCAPLQRMSLAVIDPPLRSHGIELHAAKGPRGELHLGTYVARQLLREEASEGEALLPAALPRPSRFLRLEFEVLASAERRWHVQCRGQRRQARNTELASELDVSHDELAWVCRARDPAGQVWSIVGRGDLGRGLVGEIREEATERLVFELVVTTRRTFVRMVERELPIAVVQLQRGRTTAAAMLLAAPERAWLAPKLPESEQQLALVGMLALRLLPVDPGAA